MVFPESSVSAVGGPSVILPVFVGMQSIGGTEAGEEVVDGIVRL